MKKQEKTTVERLQEADATAKQTAAELKQAQSELACLDDTQGDLDTAIEKRLRAETKIKILERRLEMAQAARDEFQGDLALDQAADMAKKYEEAKTALEKAEVEGMQRFVEFMGCPVESLDPNTQGIAKNAAKLFRGARLAAQKLESAQVENRAAEMQTAELRTKRARAESTARNQMQEQVFEGKI